MRGERDDDNTLPDETSVTTESATREERLTPEQKTERDAAERVLRQMRKRWKTADTAWSHFHENARDDAKFRAGTWGETTYQWVDNIAAERRTDGRPCLTINRAPGFVHQVTNQAREAHLRIKVSPVDDQGDPQVAEVFAGVIRNIETQSYGDWQYARASDKQAEMGLGFLRLVTEWATDDVDNVGAVGTSGLSADIFRQRIKIKGRRNPLRILLDPAYEEPDASDAAWGFEATDVDRDDFTDLFGIDPPSESDVEAFTNAGNQTGDWFPNGKIRVVEYFAREPKGAREHLALLASGDVIKYPTDEQKAKLLETLGPDGKVLRDRWVQKHHIVWRKAHALKVFEETIWPDTALPWIPVAGDELEIDGERDFRGVIRDSKDAARVYNVEVSGLVEAVGRGIKAPVVGYRGQFGVTDSPQRRAWESAHTKVHPFLEIDPMDIDGKPAPFPQPITFEPPLEGTILAIRQADQDYKSTAGFRDASLGERGPQESGVAITARQRQDELGSSHYLDNLRLALCAVGRRLIALIRVVYDVPTIVRITGKDEQQKRVMVFSGAHNDPRRDEFLDTHEGPGPRTMQDGRVVQQGGKIPFQLPKGVSGIYDLGVGEFDIEVSAGRNPGTRREEQVEAMAAVFKGLPPEYATSFMDLWFMLMDHPVAHQMAERAKRMLPPEMQDQDETADVPPAIMAKMTAMKTQLATAMQALQQMQEEIRTEKVKLHSQMLIKHEELQSKERIAGLQLKERLLEKVLAIKGEAALTFLQGQFDAIAQRTDHQHDHDVQAIDAMLAGSQQDSAQAHEAGQADADRAHATDTQLLGAALEPEPEPAAPSEGGGPA